MLILCQVALSIKHVLINCVVLRHVHKTFALPNSLQGMLLDNSEILDWVLSFFELSKNLSFLTHSQPCELLFVIFDHSLSLLTCCRASLYVFITCILCIKLYQSL